MIAPTTAWLVDTVSESGAGFTAADRWASAVLATSASSGPLSAYPRHNNHYIHMDTEPPPGMEKRMFRPGPEHQVLVESQVADECEALFRRSAPDARWTRRAGSFYTLFDFEAELPGPLWYWSGTMPQLDKP